MKGQGRNQQHEKIPWENEQARDPELIVTKHGGSLEEHGDLGESGENARLGGSPQDHEPISTENEEITKDH